MNSTRDNEDSFLFYSITISSLLESTAGTFVENLEPIYGNDPKLNQWLKTVWLPEELHHGELTKSYVTNTWPGFDWDSAYQQFFKNYQPRCHWENLRRTPALEALTRCVTEAETTMFYRCVEDYARSNQLKELMRQMSKDEARHFGVFRRVFDSYDQVENNSFLKKAQLLVRRSQLIRDEDLAMAFEYLNSSWKSPKPFQELSYQAFIVRAGEVMSVHFPFEQAKRMLLKPLRTEGKLNRLAVELVSTLVRRLYPVNQQFS